MELLRFKKRTEFFYSYITIPQSSNLIMTTIFYMIPHFTITQFPMPWDIFLGRVYS
jgi:hypothetical protein